MKQRQIWAKFVYADVKTQLVDSQKFYQFDVLGYDVQ